MADEDDQKPQELSLSEQLLAEEEQDVLFKTQMAVANFFLGYWKHMVGVVCLCLVGVLVWGGLSDYERNQQRAIHEQIAEAESQLDARLRERHQTGFAMTPGDEYPDGTQALMAVGEQLVSVANETSGLGSTFARVRAASLMQASGRADLAVNELRLASETSADGIVAWSVRAQLAALLAETDVEGAVAIYREFMDGSGSVIAGEASYRLGFLLYDNARYTEAAEIWQAFVSAYPEDPRVADLSERVAEITDESFVPPAEPSASAEPASPTVPSVEVEESTAAEEGTTESESAIVEETVVDEVEETSEESSENSSED